MIRFIWTVRVALNLSTLFLRFRKIQNLLNLSVNDYPSTYKNENKILPSKLKCSSYRLLLSILFDFGLHLSLCMFPLCLFKYRGYTIISFALTTKVHHHHYVPCIHKHSQSQSSRRSSVAPPPPQHSQVHTK